VRTIELAKCTALHAQRDNGGINISGFPDLGIDERCSVSMNLGHFVVTDPTQEVKEMDCLIAHLTSRDRHVFKPWRLRVPGRYLNDFNPADGVAALSGINFNVAAGEVLETVQTDRP
jgi:hypothetical protein